MTLEKYEINELRTICEYLDSKNPDVSALGYNLYMINYADKLCTYIKEPIEWKYNFLNSKNAYICYYQGVKIHLSFAINRLLNSYEDHGICM